MAVYRSKGGWRADFYVGGRGGRRVRKVFPTKELAEAMERDWKLREFRGDLVQVREDILLFEFIERYVELYSPGKTDNTRKLDGYIFAHIKEFFGNRTIRSIVAEDVEAYKATRLRSVKKRTVNRELDLLKSLMARGVEWAYVSKSPAEGVRRYKVDVEEPAFLTQEEGARLIVAVEGQMKTFVALALHTGLRKGELFALKWSDVGKGELRVRKSKGKRFRVIPLNVVAAGVLTRHPHHITSPYVFCGAKGKPWVDVRKSFQTALDDAGLPHIRIHDLRHSFVSNLVMAGVDIRSVQELAGHASIATTMRYAHLRPERLRDSVELLAV